jgi:hypothetical protein
MQEEKSILSVLKGTGDESGERITVKLIYMLFLQSRLMFSEENLRIPRKR